ncbi:hypothetical protein OV450_7760 [Actinobacteria bacterium OV450]|uniref:Histidine kinase n=1 Tax=Streptomyces katrae TaxID=68223 RepID=A0ABT7GSB3_9ACTN|nr:hypothetical protein [Streptomyces katrae]KPI20242.1 hypothetical protein OV450_7760 [Actinobacteria bacterium OV450]MDK9496184.1 hypothetical protein [Streptomyces katrae]
MELMRYVDDLRQELVTAAETGDAQTREIAERLVAPLNSAVRLVLLDALSTAADEITRELAPGSVEVRLRGLDPRFVVTLPPSEEPAGAPAAQPLDLALPPLPLGTAKDNVTSRINFRPPEQLKARIEEAAGREGLSVNAWLVRAASAMLGQEEPARRPEVRAAHGGQSYTGWVK